MTNQKLPMKRWSFIDTINACLMIFVMLFVVDFKTKPEISWILIIAFIVWIITVIARNIYLSKMEKRK